MSYQSYSVSLTEGQKENLARAYKKRSPITIRLKNNQLKGNFPLLLTKTQINRINKSMQNKKGVDIAISKSQISAQSQNGGFLGALASILGRTILPTLTKFVPKIAAPLATGALSGLASTGVNKLFGDGMINIPATHRAKVIGQAPLTKSQITQIKKEGRFKPTQKQIKGGFLPILAGILGTLAGPVLGSILGKGGLQIDSTPRQYRRIPRGKKKLISFENKPISNFDIMDWVKQLKIKNFDGVFSKDDTRKNNYGIMNLDDKSGPGTHWVCYVRDFYFDPFGLNPPQNIAFKQFNNMQYQKKDSVLCGYFCLFFIKMHQDGHSIYDILYKILDPLSPSKNEKIIRTYYINNGNV